MFPITSRFRAALIASHTIITRAEILVDNAYVRDLSLNEGSVSVDVDNAARRRFTATLVDYDKTLTPKTATDLLSPIRTEVRLSRGIRYSDGTEELVPLGVFDISEVNVEDSGDGVVISLSGYDRSRRVARARFIDPYVVKPGTNYATAIRDLIAFCYPGLAFNFLTTTATTPTLLFESGEDPWAAASGMAESLGAELFFDADGVCVLRRIVRDTKAEPVWTYQEGKDATLLALARKLSDEQTYNVVVASTAESFDDPTPPVRAVVRDENINSATFWLGPYGTVTKFYASPFLRTQQQAQDAAEAILARALGVVEDVSFDALTNPAHDVGDLIRITRAASGVDALYTIESLTIPLGPDGVMKATTKKRDQGT